MNVHSLPHKGISTISVVIPVLNERDNVLRAYDEVVRQFECMGPKYDYEIIFSDNHSTDGTEHELIKLAERDQRVKVLRLARNFGFERSLLTAYRASTGDAVIPIDCDLQDPPSLIPDFVERWEAGHDVVAGIREKRKEAMFLRLCRHLYYMLVTKIAGGNNLLEDAGDFRLVDRSVVDRLAFINDSHPYMRGLTSSLAANQIGLCYERDERTAGESKFPISKLCAFAANGLVSNSLIPLRLATFTGILAFVISALVGLYYLTAWMLVGQEWPRGFATTTLLLVFGIGLNGIFIGIVGEYVGRIYEQVRQRPTTIIEWSINMDDTSALEHAQVAGRRG
ncbi:MAG: glycosyltransferase family 2 protein [Geminicoccaceae bacterium]